MFDKIRQGTRSFFIKIFLGVIIVSFAVWGIGDIFRSPTESQVASIGGTTISLGNFLSEFRRTMARLRSQFGTDFDQNQALALGYDRLVLGNMISREIARQDAEQLGILISDETIGRGILADPNFHDEFGVFNRFYFDRLLSISGFNETTYIQEERVRIAGSHIRSGLAGGQMMPEALAAELYRYRQQKRVADLIILQHNSLAITDGPTNTQLAEYYQSHLSEFTTPEERTFRYVYLTADEFIDEVEIASEDLQAEYSFRISQFTTEPTRDFLQMVFNTFDEADAAYRDLQAGEDFSFIAEERLGLAETDIVFTAVLASNLPGAIADDVLALESNELSRPLETDFGWYVVKVTAATDGNVRSFEEVRDELYLDLASNRAIDLMVGIANDIDDALAAGSALTTIAANFGLDLVEAGPLTVFGPADAPIGPPEERLSAVLPKVFESYEGAESELFLTENDDYFMIEIIRIDAPRVLPFEDVLLQSTAGWRVAERFRLAEQKAAGIAERLTGGARSSEIGSTEPVTLRISMPLSRYGISGDPNVGSGLRDLIFAGGLGSTVLGLSQDGLAHVVAQVLRIDEPSTGGSFGVADEDAYERWRVSLDNTWQSNILAAYEQGLNQEFSVSIYPNVLRLAFETPAF